jgi:hypothetical protein
MGRSGRLILACSIVSALHGAGAAVAQVPAAPGAASQAVAPPRDVRPIESRPQVEAPAAGDDRPVLVPTTKEYQWIVRVPVVSIERRRIMVAAPDVSTHWKRWDYEMPALRDRRIKLWDFPEFSCKYPDLILPNDCRTVWRPVYVDAPVLVSERGHIDLELSRLGMSQQSIVVEVPRWSWADKSFRFSLPAVAPAQTVQRLRVALNAQRTDLAAATDATIANLTEEIEALRARGEDPSELVDGDGSSLDLLAHRQSLLDQRAQELERLAAIDAELAELSAR